MRGRFNIDESRIGICGISDGGSMALSLATQNPEVFQAAMSTSAGFCVPPPPATASAPSLFLQHGERDRMFPLEQVGMRNRDLLRDAGYTVAFKVAYGQGHVPEAWGETWLPAWLALAAGRRASAL